MDSVSVEDRMAFKSAIGVKNDPHSASVASSSDNPLFKSEKAKLHQNEMGGNFGDLEETEEDDEAGGFSCCGPGRTCTKAGWRSFFRFLQCPFAKPRTLKTIKNPSELKSIHLNLPSNPLKNTRPDNLVITSKYTPWDFFPRAMALQFRRAVNVFYLVQVVLLIVGYFFPSVFESPFTPFGTMGVLAFVLSVTLITEFKDDRGRHRQDSKTNNKRVIQVKQGANGNRKHVTTTWGQLIPGDFVLLKNRELVPADVLVVESSAKQNGMVYIETSGIDGETNLKIRRAPKEFANNTRDLLTGDFEYEEPNPFLGFSGTFRNKQNQESVPLSFENLLLRGSEVRNTTWVLCVVMYAGHETKLVLSKRATPSKFSTLDYLINRIVIMAVIQLFIMVAISLICLFALNLFPNTDKLWYFSYTDTTSIFVLPPGLAFFLTFYVIYGNLVPIDLYVVMEISTGIQSWLLCRDLKMYDAHTDTPAGSKSTNLVTEIGQVSHVFSDKTGTLTQNVMRLVGCSLAGKRYGVQVPDAVKQNSATQQMELKNTEEMDKVLGKRTLDFQVVFHDMLQQVRSNPLVAEFLLVLALCHTVVMDLDEQGFPRYNAEGPDEEALVKAAAALGFVLLATENDVYEVKDTHNNVIHKYQVLGVNGFNSDRKRMSIVLKNLNTGEHLLMLKGADSVVAERTRVVPPQLQLDLDSFAQAGLRTLLVAAKRNISSQEISTWQQRFTEAKNQIGQQKVVALEQCAELLEQNLELVGATAIEDALQEGVPETIQMLRDAQIKVWVLTGDKVDTAVNIGFSSKLLDSNMHQIFLDGSSTQEMVNKLDELLAALEQEAKGQGIANPMQDQDAWTSKSLALVLTGKAVELLLAKQKGTQESQAKLVALANACSVVLACRVSPAQKALIVRASTQSARKRGARPVVSLAIGDGANDVPMIQEARIGVGISGKEGLQAVNSADFSIAQFSFLSRLLFVHGRLSYKRSATLLTYVCYSWQVLNWPIFFYMFYCMFSGQQVYIQTFYITIFAWVIHVLPLVNACLEVDLSPQTIAKFPESYDLGRLNQMLSNREILTGTFLRGLLHSVLFYFALITLHPPEQDISVFGSFMYLGVMLMLQVRFMHQMVHFNWIFCVFLLLWLIWLPATMTAVDVVFGDISLLNTYDWPFAYASVFLLIGAVVLLEYGVNGFRRVFYPTKTEVLMEIDRLQGSENSSSVLALREVWREGVNQTIFLQASRVKEAVSKRKKHRVIDAEAGILGVEVQEMQRAKSGYVDSGPM